MIDSEPDVLACISVILATIVLLFSVKIYAVVNFALVTTSALFVLSFICVGFFHVHIHNWTRKPGFFPLGLRGVPNGAAIYFYAFTGIDNIATSSDDVRHHSQSVPVAMIVTCILSFLLYMGTTTSLTLSFSWKEISDIAPLAKAFEDKDIYAAKYIVGVGAVLGLSAGVLAALFVTPRLLASMSRDGLFPRVLSRANSRTKAPICATVFLGLFTSVCALVLDFYSAVEMLSIASIFAYFLCALCVLCLRYSTCDVGVYKEYSEFDMENSVKTNNRSSSCKKENGLPKLEVLHDGNFNLHYANYVTHVNCDSTSVAERSLSDSLLQELEEENEDDEDDEEGDEEGGDGDEGCEEESEVEDIENMEKRNETKLSNYSIKESMSKSNSRQSFKTDVINLSEKTQLRASMSQHSFNSVVILPGHAHTDPDAQSWKHTKSFILAYIISSSCLCFSFIIVALEYADGAWWAIAISCVCVIGMMTSSYLISRQPQNRAELLYRTPYVPYVPLAAMLLSMVLMSALSVKAWCRFAAWLILGLVFYWLYGIRHSNVRSDDDEEVALYDVTEQHIKVPVH